MCRTNNLCTFWCGKNEGFGIYGGQNSGSAIETAGHPYNSAALPQRLITDLLSVYSVKLGYCFIALGLRTFNICLLS